MTDQQLSPDESHPPHTDGESPPSPHPTAAGDKASAGALGVFVRRTAWLWLLLALGAAFARNFVEMWTRWYPAWRHTDWSLYDRLVEGKSYYTHGPLIPMVSLLITVLIIRHVKIRVRPDRKMGSAVLGLSLLVHLAASLARVNFVSAFALIGVVTGLVLILWGRQALRTLWFPIALLAFMVPLPEVSIASINFRMKQWAASIGVNAANAIGVIAERDGNRVFLPGDKTMVIANVCNGLRTLISLLAFGALYAYVCKLRGLWRIFLFSLTIPVALLSNSIRIVSLIVVADIWTVDIATGFYHDTSGVLIFVLAFFLMFGLESVILGARKLIGRPAKVLPLFDGRLRDPAEDANQWPTMRSAVSANRGLATVLVLALTAGGVWWMSRTIPLALSDDMVANAVPARMTFMGLDWNSHKMELSDEDKMTLEYPSCLYRRYKAPQQGAAGPWVDFCLIFSRDNRKGTHPPDLCLEGGGDGIELKHTVTVEDIPGHDEALACRELVVQSGDRRILFLYTYKCGGRYTPSFWAQQMTIFANGLVNRNASGALIRVSTPATSSIDAARTRAKAMMRAAIPHLDKNLP